MEDIAKKIIRYLVPNVSFDEITIKNSIKGIDKDEKDASVIIKTVSKNIFGESCYVDKITLNGCIKHISKSIK